ncbi:MAG: Asp-tRNA(Asn)/Glu-tRNA(Gln) amidotransferase subunit GatB [Candidatus Omnitrophota bacterium]
MNEFDIVVGLEVHVQLETASKIFCSCSTRFENPPNSNICPVCCGYPGVLPVFNRKALELALRVSLALGCQLNKKIYFERKNYFYPDLPKNYQISQYKMPLGENGRIDLLSGSTVRIARVHLEEDAGKLVHREQHSLVDFNRTGIPLLEIVSHPDINSPGQAYEYLNALKLILQYIGASECDMEKGSLRCDANISLKRKEETKLGTKVELKNMNSFKGVRDALEYEAGRQEASILKNEQIFQETRLWDADNSRTEVMRSKEEAHDYRYFPEPDLLDFTVEESLIELQRHSIPELPLAKRRRFLQTYRLSDNEIDTIISDAWLSDFFEQSCRIFAKPDRISNWLLGPFLEQVNLLPDTFDGVKISPQNFAKIVQYFSEDKLNNLAAKKTLALSVATNRDIDEIITQENLIQVSGQEELSSFVAEAIQEGAKAVKEYLEGKEQAIMFLVGMVMKKTKGKANPKVVRQLLEESLKK